MNDPQARLAERIRKLLVGYPNVEEKRLMGKLAFMVDGSMCCSVSEGSLLVRVIPSERDTLLEQAHVSTVQMGKRTMHGFVRVAPPAYRSGASLKRWLELGIAAGANK